MATGGEDSGNGVRLHFNKINSSVNPAFWNELARRKLHEYKLSTESVSVAGFFQPGNTRLALDWSGFDSDLKVPPGSLPMRGTLINTNTFSDFKSSDFKQLIELAGREIHTAILSGEALVNPAEMCKFTVVTFADMKCHHFYYWFCFPALTRREALPDMVRSVTPASSTLNENQLANMDSLMLAGEHCASQHCFLIDLQPDAVTMSPLTEIESASCDTLVVVQDPCALDQHPGWLLRNVIELLRFKWPASEETITILLWRGSAAKSKIMQVALARADGSAAEGCAAEGAFAWDQFKVMGWESNARDKLSFNKVDLSAMLDPIKLAESSLVTWCEAARYVGIYKVSAAWRRNLRVPGGAKSAGLGLPEYHSCRQRVCESSVVTGKVSYSNPVRQTLFDFEDCQGGGAFKAECAAAKLKQIFPMVEARGVVMGIPMPGHTVTDQRLPQVLETVDKLDNLISTHDVVFLLTDTRESRWLPTVMARAHGKQVMNIALGFDTFLAMRHGAASAPTEAPNLGCYFCSEVTAPTNSTVDRTLDQQCTVTRPGLTGIASAIGTEMLVTLLHHPLKGCANASSEQQPDPDKQRLGGLPHQVRGGLRTMNNKLHMGFSFDRCIACSSHIVKQYISDRNNLILQAMNNPTSLEDATGITELKAECDDLSDFDWDSDEDEE